MIPSTIVKVRRFDPAADAAPHWIRYEVPVRTGDTVLDLLQYVKWEIDGSLTFRRSSADGSCGSDTMRINGRNRLAGATAVRDLAGEIIVEPIKGLPLVKDLVVDLAPFFAAHRDVRAFAPAPSPADASGERRQTPAQLARIVDTAQCNLCGACTSACPVFWTDSGFTGPAAIVASHRFVFDSRDADAGTRLDLLDERDGVWRCRTTFSCTEACPRGIEVTQAIAEVKRAVLRRHA